MWRILKTYGLLVLAAAALIFCAVFPQYCIAVRYVHIVCIVLAVFGSRSFLREQDIRGWALQSAALLAHAGCLVAEGYLFAQIG